MSNDPCLASACNTDVKRLFEMDWTHEMKQFLLSEIVVDNLLEEGPSVLTKGVQGVQYSGFSSARGRRSRYSGFSSVRARVNVPLIED